MSLANTSSLLNALVADNDCENGRGDRGALGFFIKLVGKGLSFYDLRKVLDGSRNDQKTVKIA